MVWCARYVSEEGDAVLHTPRQYWLPKLCERVQLGVMAVAFTAVAGRYCRVGIPFCTHPQVQALIFRRQFEGLCGEALGGMETLRRWAACGLSCLLQGPAGGLSCQSRCLAAVQAPMSGCSPGSDVWLPRVCPAAFHGSEHERAPPPLSTHRRACEQLRGSTRLRRVLATVLAAGNQLNAGTVRGSAGG